MCRRVSVQTWCGAPETGRGQDGKSRVWSGHLLRWCRIVVTGEDRVDRDKRCTVADADRVLLAARPSSHPIRSRCLVAYATVSDDSSHTGLCSSKIEASGTQCEASIPPSATPPFFGIWFRIAPETTAYSGSLARQESRQIILDVRLLHAHAIHSPALSATRPRSSASSRFPEDPAAPKPTLSSHWSSVSPSSVPVEPAAAEPSVHREGRIAAKDSHTWVCIDQTVSLADYRALATRTTTSAVTQCQWPWPKTLVRPDRLGLHALRSFSHDPPITKPPSSTPVGQLDHERLHV